MYGQIKIFLLNFEGRKWNLNICLIAICWIWTVGDKCWVLTIFICCHHVTGFLFVSQTAPHFHHGTCFAARKFIIFFNPCFWLLIKYQIELLLWFYFWNGKKFLSSFHLWRCRGCSVDWTTITTDTPVPLSGWLGHSPRPLSIHCYSTVLKISHRVLPHIEYPLIFLF